MASIPCSIHIEFSSTSTALAPWSHPSSPPELCSAGGLGTRFLGSTQRLCCLRDSPRARAGVCLVGVGGGAEERCSKPRNWCIAAQIRLQSSLRLSMRHQQFSKQVKLSGKNLNFVVSPLGLSPTVRERANMNWSRPLSAADSSEVTSEDSPPTSTNSRDVTSEPTNVDSLNTERAASSTQFSSSDVQPIMSKPAKTIPETQENAIERPPLTAREKLRAARVLSRYTESRPSRSELGSRVLDAIRETDKGKRPGLPEAPSNLFDDSKRGLPKQGFTFDFPGGTDILIIAFSFVFISTVMFATTYIVWKAGAIHFNEY